MPVIVVKGLPCIPLLKEEGVNITDERPSRGKTLRIALLNLMPMKEYAEMDFYRMLSHSRHTVEVLPVKLSGQRYKNAPQEYVDSFYTDFHSLLNEDFDGLIITGAPVEQMAFEEVRYWDQMLEVYEWEKKHARTCLHICWGAQAALYAQYGIRKHIVPQKVFGIFEQMAQPLPLLSGLTPHFPMPQSRHTEMIPEDLAREERVEVIAASPLSGPGVIRAKDRAEFYVTGHLEYSPLRIDFEYHRDLEKRLPIHLPFNYYKDDDPEAEIIYSWRKPGICFFTNWINNYVFERGK